MTDEDEGRFDGSPRPLGLTPNTIVGIIAMQDATIASQLLVAVRTRDARSISRLCTTKSDQLKAALRRRDGQGHTLMHWAAKAGDVDVLEILAGEGVLRHASTLLTISLSMASEPMSL